MKRYSIIIFHIIIFSILVHNSSYGKPYMAKRYREISDSVNTYFSLSNDSLKKSAARFLLENMLLRSFRTTKQLSTLELSIDSINRTTNQYPNNFNLIVEK